MPRISIYNDCCHVTYFKNTGNNNTKFCEVVDTETGEIIESDTRTENLKKGRLDKSGFGKSARRRFMYCIDAFANVFEAMQAKKSEHLKYKFDNRIYNRKPVFMTLTIPNQTLSDKECNRNLLNVFLTVIKKYFPVKMWLWRSEVQNRGALHYHLILDCFIPFKFARKLWFNILFKNKQHGTLENHDKASRIVYINRIDKLDSIKFYLQKYLTEIDGRNNERVNKHDKTTILRKINAREWGCSDSLKNVNTIYENVTNQMVLNLENNCIEKKDIKTKQLKTIADIFIFKKFIKKAKNIYEKIVSTTSLLIDNLYRLNLQAEHIYNPNFEKPNNKIDLYEERAILLNQIHYNNFILNFNK